ncbi:MAG: hypothetical protein JW395_1500 [Nitrospira sp.]|nr:hypothetical protein [Nitrospira sp.]
MQLTKRHVDALDAAQERMFHCDFCGYLELKELLRDDSESARELFRNRFTGMYGLNVGGLTDQFKKRFFEILHSDDVMTNGRPGYDRILSELGSYKRKTGHPGMPFSFVSKLVAMRDEGSPIYDRHVLAFFRGKLPGPAVKTKERIEAFVAFLDGVGQDYRAWSADERILPILTRFKDRDPRLRKCDVVRLMDFLVWKVGNQKLLQ